MTENPLKCDDVCSKKFHHNRVSVSRSVWKYINDMENLKWLCDDKFNNNHNKLLFGAIDNKVEKLYRLCDQKQQTTETV
jgi:hypothetical protein